MPEIPTFTANDILPIVRDGARSDPGALAAPGLAQQRAGQQLEQQISGHLNQLADWQNYQYNADNWAEGTTKAHEYLQNETDKARQSGDYQGFAQRVGSTVQQDLQQRLDNAPSSMARSRLEKHFASLQDSIGARASVFEHSMGQQDAAAKLDQFREKSSSLVYRDPSLFPDLVSQGQAMLAGGDAAKQLGITERLNPLQSEKALKALHTSLAAAALMGRAEQDPIAAANDLKAGKYDAYLDAAALEKLKPQLNQASIKGYRARLSPFNNGPAPETVGPQPDASDAAADAALAPIIARESSGNPFVGYTPKGQPLVDLSKAPLDDTGFPIWSGNQGPAGISHAAGLFQIQPDTWRPIARQLGVHDFSADSQRKVARELYRQQGLAPWAASAGGGGGLANLFAHVDRLNLDPEVAEPLKRGLVSDYAAIETDQARQQRQADKAITERNNAAENRIIADSRSDHPTITAKDVANMPDLKPDAKLRMIAFLAKDGNVDPGLSHQTAMTMMRNIAAGGLTDQAPIIDAFGKGQLNWTDFDHLNKQLADVKTPAGEQLSKRKEEFIKSVMPEIAPKGMLAMMTGSGLPDALEGERLYRFRWDLDQKIDEYRKAGKDPSDLLNPSKPDYLGKPEAIKPYRGSIAAHLGDAVAPKAAARPSGPPPSAVEFLRAHPELKSQFEMKYGPGSAATALTPSAPIAR